MFCHKNKITLHGPVNLQKKGRFDHDSTFWCSTWLAASLRLYTRSGSRDGNLVPWILISWLWIDIQEIKWMEPINKTWFWCNKEDQYQMIQYLLHCIFIHIMFFVNNLAFSPFLRFGIVWIIQAYMICTEIESFSGFKNIRKTWPVFSRCGMHFIFVN